MPHPRRPERGTRPLAAEGLRRPVVVVTGVEDEELVERSIETGRQARI